MIGDRCKKSVTSYLLLKWVFRNCKILQDLSEHLKIYVKTTLQGRHISFPPDRILVMGPILAMTNIDVSEVV